MDLNATCKTKTLLEDNRGGNFCNRKVFSDKMPKARSIEEKLDKLDTIQVKIFYLVKDALRRMKGQVFQDWEKKCM